jgi:hypothetical protein
MVVLLRFSAPSFQIRFGPVFSYTFSLTSSEVVESQLRVTSRSVLRRQVMDWFKARKK